MEDTAILDLYWARDERAITETQKSYGKYCYSIAYHILHDREDTEECLNDTWMRAWNAIPPKKPNRLELFLGTITRNLSFDRWKGRHAQKRGNGTMDMALDELAECIPAAHDTESIVEAAELERSTMLSCIRSPNRNVMFFYEGTGSWRSMSRSQSVMA